MQKIIFNELGFIPNENYCEEDSIIKLNIKGHIIEMKTSLFTEEKVSLISEIIGCSIDDGIGYFNPLRLDIMSTIIGMKYYSNLEFDEIEKLNSMDKRMAKMESKLTSLESN